MQTDLSLMSMSDDIHKSVLLEFPKNVKAEGTMERQMQDNMPCKENGNHQCDRPLFKYPTLSRLLITHRSRASLGNLGKRLPELGPCLSLTVG